MSETEDIKRTPDWKWLVDLLNEYTITDKRNVLHTSSSSSSLEARLYREIQNKYRQRKKPDYIIPATNARTSKQYEDSLRIHGEQIKTMEDMGYGLMLDGFTFYKVGYELEPYDFEQNFQMHQAYEIHKFVNERVAQATEVSDNTSGSAKASPKSENR